MWSDYLIKIPFEDYENLIKGEEHYARLGKVSQVIGLIIRVEGLKVFIGEVCEIIINSTKEIVMAEVVGFQNSSVLLMPLGELHGIGPGSLVKPTGHSLRIQICDDLLGSTLDGLGNPIDKKISGVGKLYDINRAPPSPFSRRKIEDVMSTGIKAIDGILTCGEGQRIGIFSGSGVGKSTLLGMIARYCEADVIVIGLIGERGRELLEFIERDLGSEGYKKSVVVCATSDQPPLVRLKGAFVATSIAEYFRDQGKKVVLMMDSVTRFAMAQREIGLATGEPPTTRGYTPSVFAILPKLLERSGMSASGSITAFYTVLVEGDDMNEPIADAVRGILDGHIILSRDIAAENHFPAIDIQNSISRIMKDIVDDEQYLLAGKVKENLAIYDKSKDLINVGAYKEGNNPILDKAVKLNSSIKNFLKQDINDKFTQEESSQVLKSLFEDNI